MKRLFDILFSLLLLLMLSPLFIIFSLLIIFDSKGGIFFKQVRVGKDGKDFNIYKFRTMYTGSEKKGLLTIGDKDNRVTGIGCFLRKHKLDELPQLFNVLKGDMSIVGPRPEVRKYVDMYNEEQRKVLSIRPGITEYASLNFSNESEILSKSDDPEQLYISELMPEKLRLNLQYIKEQSFLGDLKIIWKTIGKIF